MSQDREVETSSEKMCMFEIGEDPKHPCTSRFWLHDFIFQTSIYGKTPVMAFKDNLNNTAVCSTINSLPVMLRGPN